MPQTRNARGVMECLRLDRTGQVIDTQYQLVSREESYGDRGYYSTAPNPFGWFQSLQQQFYDQRREHYNEQYYGRQVPREAVRPPAQNGQYYRRDPRAQQQPQRVEPNFWGFRRF
jgi:hypothetical protein